MRRIAATLAVIALLFSAGSAWADSNSGANILFVEAVILVNSAENVEGLEEKAAALEEALGKLNKIIDNYKSSDLAVKLISNQAIGDISLKDVARAAERARGKAERAAERAREEEIAREEFEMTLKLAEQGDAKAQYNLGIRYDKGRGVPENDAEAVKWWRKAAEQGHEDAQWYLEQLKLGACWRRDLDAQYNHC